MRAMRRLLVLATISVLFSACGGNGNGKSQQVQISDPPSAPTVTVSADIKQLVFSWEAVATATHYRLLENPDGHSGFTQVGGNIPSAETSVARDIAAHLHDWVNALYLVQACNAGGCTDSTQVSATDLMLDTIGYFKASDTASRAEFGWAISLSADGSTLAVGAPMMNFMGAVYVFKSDGNTWSQHAIVKASNAEIGDEFGYSVALSGDGNTLAVGARSEASSATGINGDQADNSAEYAGAVYVFRSDGAGWIQETYFKASNTEAISSTHHWWRGYFGYSVVLSDDGNTLAVGAPGENGSAIGINGDQSDSLAVRSGAVYLFRFDGIDWFQQAYVKASNTGTDDRFGRSVAVSADGNTLAVGAPYEDSVATGINGDQYADEVDWVTGDPGAAYVFRFHDADWYQQAYVKASNTGNGDWVGGCEPNQPEFCYTGGDFFGSSVALSADGNTLAVGAEFENSSATGINGDQADNSAEAAGAVYLFRFDETDWYQEAYVKASNTDSGDRFGSTIALSTDGNTLAVGARYESGGATAINGDQAIDYSASGSGAVYLFRLDNLNWTQQAYVKASNTGSRDYFGSSVALGDDGNALAVGANLEDSSATSINGDQADNSAENAGAVYVY